jgi:alkylation response protein AidB-like acyl-CoA dehydrogenase
MRFALSAEQQEFGAAVHGLLADADVPAAARAWAAGDHEPGLAIWRSLAKAGVTALAVPESLGGLGAHPVDLVVACEELGHHPLPGPVAESVAAVPALLTALAVRAGPRTADAQTAADANPQDAGPGDWLAELAAGELVATLAWPPRLPYALDADVAGLVLLVGDGQHPAGDGAAMHGAAGQHPAVPGSPGSMAGPVWRATPGARLESVDQARRLFDVRPDTPLTGGLAAEPGAALAAEISRAVSYGTLASAAQLLGAGRGLLEASIGHARTREQFGRPIGAFQAVKHALADVLIGLEFARPLLYAAAIALGADAPTTARDISAARVACADAAQLAARTALQVHGAIGYTQECDISLWLAKVRALAATWGSQAEHRAVVLAALTAAETGAWS